jgi:hypothetical protein
MPRDSAAIAGARTRSEVSVSVERFGRDRMVDEYAEVYRAVLSERR